MDKSRSTPSDRIRELAARFELAETSLAEERELGQLLGEVDRPAELPSDLRSLHRYFQGATALTSLRAQQPLPELMQVPSTDKRLQARRSRRPVRRIQRPWLLAAASIGLLLVLGLALITDVFSPEDVNQVAQTIPADGSAASVDWSRYEVTDPAEAERIMLQALRRTSIGLRRGRHLTGEGLEQMSALGRLAPRGRS